jgi:hypothetical protein
MFRHQNPGLGRVFLYLLTQPVDMRLQGMGHQRRRMIPDIGIQCFAGDDRVARPVKLF